MNNTHSNKLSIDVSLLDMIRDRGDTIVARCPACSVEEGDRKGDHFFLNLETGKWGCAAYQGDRDHRREIFALVGIKDERPPDRSEWREAQRKERMKAESRRKLANAARAKRAAIVERWLWEDVDVWESSPQRIDQHLVEYDARHFLQSLFPQNAIIWTGRVYESGTRHARRWRTVTELQESPIAQVGPLTTPAIWKPNIANRSGDNVFAAPYTVLDFDELDGRKPETPEEIAAHVRASLALTNWLRCDLHWKLAAIVWTGSKSIHAWFQTPPHTALTSLKTTARSLGIDAGLVGHPEHPCRLPGWMHDKTGKNSRVLWLQVPVT